MIGKQVVNNFMEFLYPWVAHFFQRNVGMNNSELLNLQGFLQLVASTETQEGDKGWESFAYGKRRSLVESLTRINFDEFMYTCRVGSKITIFRYLNYHWLLFAGMSEDCLFQDPGRLALFDEYLEMSEFPPLCDDNSSRNFVSFQSFSTVS